MTRIVAGTHRGRRLVVPRGGATRPTSDRAREGIFSSLLSLVDLEGARILDLYAGTGALGLEALSRGASQAVLVEREPGALAALQRNVRELDLPGTVVDADVLAFLRGPATPYEVVLVDPPYDVAAEPVLTALGPWLAAGAVVVVERRTGGGEPGVPPGLALVRSRRYGEATLWYFRAT